MFLNYEIVFIYMHISSWNLYEYRHAAHIQFLNVHKNMHIFDI